MLVSAWFLNKMEYHDGFCKDYVIKTRLRCLKTQEIKVIVLLTLLLRNDKQHFFVNLKKNLG